MPSHMSSLIALCLLAAQVSRDIKNKDDMALLNDRILQLMVNMGIKNFPQWSKKLGLPWTSLTRSVLFFSSCLRFDLGPGLPCLWLWLKLQSALGVYDSGQL